MKHVYVERQMQTRLPGHGHGKGPCSSTSTMNGVRLRGESDGSSKAAGRVAVTHSARRADALGRLAGSSAARCFKRCSQPTAQQQA